MTRDARYFDLQAIPTGDRYKLLTGLVVPRPIALVTTVSETGVVNAAPFSFFNVFAADPAVVVLGIESRPDGPPKDTTRNARDTGVFVVNMVDEALAAAMNDCAVDFPPDLGEPAALGLAIIPGIQVPVPRLAAAPAALECRKLMMINFGPRRDLLIGEVLAIHARDGVVDPASLRVDFAVYKPVGRLVGSLYSRQHDRFSLDRETFAQWSGRRPDDTRGA
jgi:flavin reductase (DIM6/NTAB) family NADH-FMN oxidoreductase RutF